MIPATRTPIGLDIGPRSIRAAQFAPPSRPGDLARLVAATIVPRVDPDGPLTTREMERLAGILDRQGFAGRRIVAAIPDDLLLSTSFELPGAASGSAAPPLAAISRVELARAAGCGPQMIESAAWPMPRTARSRSSHVMAMGCLNADADATLNALESAGLDCLALDCRPAAIARAVLPETCTQPGICAVIDLDWNCTSAVILFGGVIIYHRTGGPDTAAGSVLNQVRENLGIGDALARRLLLRSRETNGAAPTLLQSQADALLDEHLDLLAEDIAMAVAYASHRYPEPAVDLLLLTGEAARLSGAPAFLAARLEAQVRVFDPGKSVLCDQDLLPASRQPALAAAMGLALWEMPATEVGGHP